MTEYAPRGGQDQNSFYTNQPFGLSHYSNGNGYNNYLYSHGQVPYSTVNGSYSSFPPHSYLPSHHNSVYMPQSSNMSSHSYHLQPPPRPSMTMQRGHSYMAYPPSTQQMHRIPQPRLSLPADLSLNPMADIESQDSFNQDSMLSEPMTPPLEGYPDVHAFDALMKRYVADLSPKKQDKALIHARRAANIRMVLIDKKTTTVESAQFRFWVKKMFQLLPSDPKLPDRKKKICHEGKPVAVREKLFKILTRAHKACQHGGRDKTSAQVRRVYSWVPKELISRFVKLCPTCQVRRGATRNSPPADEKSPPDEYTDSPETTSPTTRRESVATKGSSISMHSPLSMAGFSSTFQQQNRWMTSLPPSESKYQDNDTYSSATHNVSCSSASQYGSSFSSLNNGHCYSTSSGFPSSNMRSTNGDGWQQSPPIYGVKHEPRYG